MTVTEITVPFSQYNTVRWEYRDGVYARYNDGAVHKDQGLGKQITAKNVVVMWAKYERANRDKVGSNTFKVKLGGTGRVIGVPQRHALRRRMGREPNVAASLQGQRRSADQAGGGPHVVPGAAARRQYHHEVGASSRLCLARARGYNPVTQSTPRRAPEDMRGLSLGRSTNS